MDTIDTAFLATVVVAVAAIIFAWMQRNAAKTEKASDENVKIESRNQIKTLGRQLDDSRKTIDRQVQTLAEIVIVKAKAAEEIQKQSEIMATRSVGMNIPESLVSRTPEEQAKIDEQLATYSEKLKALEKEKLNLAEQQTAVFSRAVELSKMFKEPVAEMAAEVIRAVEILAASRVFIVEKQERLASVRPLIITTADLPPHSSGKVYSAELANGESISIQIGYGVLRAPHDAADWSRPRGEGKPIRIGDLAIRPSVSFVFRKGDSNGGVSFQFDVTGEIIWVCGGKERISTEHPSKLRTQIVEAVTETVVSARVKAVQTQSK